MVGCSKHIEECITWNLILITSRGDVTVLDIPPEIAPAVASIKALLSCPVSSISPNSHNNYLQTQKETPLCSNVKKKNPHLAPTKTPRVSNFQKKSQFSSSHTQKPP